MTSENYTANEKENVALNLYKKNKKIADDYQTPIFDKLLILYYLYRNYQKEVSYPFRNKICLPIAFSTIETLTPRVVLNQGKITLTARKEESKQYEESSKRILEYDWNNRNFQLEINDWFKRCLIYGTSVIKVYFSREKVKRPRTSVLGKFFRGKFKTEVKEEMRISSLEPFRFKIDPDANYIREARYVINTIYLTEEEVKDNREGIYKNTKYVTAVPVTDDYIASKRQIFSLTEYERGKINTGATTTTATGSTRELVKVDELYIRSSKKHPLGRLIVVANNDIILRDDINPYWYIDGEFPFVEIKDHYDPGEFYAQGEIEPIEALIYEKNQIRNRRLDSTEQSADKMWMIDPEADIDENELVWQPGGIVHAKPGEVDVIDNKGGSPTMVNEENIVGTEIANTIGVSDYSKGIGQKYETATGMLALIQEANQRFALKIKLFGEVGTARLSKMILQIEEAEAKKPRIINILGEGKEFLKVKPSEISSDFDISINIDPSPLINKISNLQQLTQVLSVIGGDPNINKKPILKAIFRLLNVLSEAEIEEMFGVATPEEAMNQMGGEGMPPGSGGAPPTRGKLPRKMKLLTAEKMGIVGESGVSAGKVQPVSSAGTTAFPRAKKIAKKIPLLRNIWK